ncbi:tyrosine-type recombinase/integrase [Actinopolyspora halophila]|uniref:tyrosine-type recombinase/integrase n=1 Tax=Actinopolyspora halophila TaxID=1850 RepID=UPI001B7F940A|nr:site-specific integrase [Actinopolyspora halophila]
MSAHEVEPGVWRCRCNYRDHAGRKHRPERFGTTKTEALNRLREAVRDWREATPDDVLSPDTLMRVLGDKWLTEVTDEVASGARSQTTLDRYRQRLHQWVYPALGNLRAREVSTLTINRVLRDVRSNTSSTNARTVRSVLSGLCGYAVTTGAMKNNPVREAIVLEVDRTPSRALSTEEVLDLLARLDRSEHARKHDLPDLVRFMLATGERIGEALGARWDDVDHRNQQLTIGRNLTRTSTGLVVNSGKTDAARRTIPLPQWCLGMLTERCEQLADPPANDDLIFPSSTGTAREPANIYNRAWGPFRISAGYEWVTFRTFRRTVATLLDDAGLTARQIADVLGHAHPSMTQDVYMGRFTGRHGSADVLERLHSPSFHPDSPQNDG